MCTMWAQHTHTHTQVRMTFFTSHYLLPNFSN
jgi:hypothetical protein